MRWRKSPEAVEVVAGEDEEPLFPPVQCAKYNCACLLFLFSLFIFSSFLQCAKLCMEDPIISMLIKWKPQNHLPGEKPIPLLPEKAFLHSTPTTFSHKVVLINLMNNLIINLMINLMNNSLITLMINSMID